MSEGKTEMRYFRYMKLEHALEGLNDGHFKVSRLSDFNDPAECRVRFFNSGDVPALRKYVHENYSRLRFGCIQSTSSYTPDEQDRFSEDFIYDQYLESSTKHEQANDLQTFDNIILVMCLVKEKGLKAGSDTLFWGHYGDSGRGARITFDLEEKPRCGLYYLKDVDYADSVPAFDLSSFDIWMKGPAFEKYIGKIASTKGLAWSYENETRMFIPRRNPLTSLGVQHIFAKTIKGKRMYFVGIEPGVIKRVDFGPRVSNEDAEDIADGYRAKQETAHIHWFKTEFDPERYSYVYRRIAS